MESSPDAACETLVENAFRWDAICGAAAGGLTTTLRCTLGVAEPLGCAMNIFERSEVRSGHSLAIVGVGFLGLLLTQLAARAGARVVALSRREHALDLARRMGAAATVRLADDSEPVQRAIERNDGRCFERVIEAVGVQSTLDVATAPVFTINGLKREELIAMNSMILHEIYFDSLGAGGAPTGNLAQALARDFGSVARWQAEFSAMGKAEGGGSGWVLLTWLARDKRLVNQWAADHTNNVAGGQPILALDMYEHSYHMDYGSGAAGYVDAFMAAINWNSAASAFERAAKA